jgi:uncharacterized protein YrzB (UPF0473 family)
MENFFNWISKPLPKEEVVIWFNVHNMIYERIELYGDIFKSLNQIILDTYMGESVNDSNETKISLTQEDNDSHFQWCWDKTINNFKRENILINPNGKHKDYLESFYMETFYNQFEKDIKESIPSFLDEIFDIFKPFSKSDLDMITEMYKLMEKNVK